jgi:hypothetical protein
MKTIRLSKSGLIALAFGCLFLSSCTTTSLTGQIVKQSREVGTFDGVALAFSGDIFITQGSPQKVEIEADQSVQDIIIAKIEDGTLVLKIKDGHWHDLGKINAYITMPEINQLSVSGSGDLICETPVKTNEIDVKVSGSGSIRMQNLESHEVSAVITGSGDITLAGSTSENGELDAVITGSGSFKSDEMAFDEAEVTITGSGSAKVNVLKELETNITGSGSVLYKGNPMINANATGSGRTKSIN